MISYLLLISESETTADKFAISCQKYHGPIPFFCFNPQLIEGVSPGEIEYWKIEELILQTKQYLASQVSTILYILVIYHYCRMYKINLTN